MCVTSTTGECREPSGPAREWPSPALDHHTVPALPSPPHSTSGSPRSPCQCVVVCVWRGEVWGRVWARPGSPCHPHSNSWCWCGGLLTFRPAHTPHLHTPATSPSLYRKLHPNLSLLVQVCRCGCTGGGAVSCVCVCVCMEATVDVYQVLGSLMAPVARGRCASYLCGWVTSAAGSSLTTPHL